MLHLKCSNILLLFYRNNKCLHFKASNVSILKFSKKKKYKNHLFLLLSRFLGKNKNKNHGHVQSILMSKMNCFSSSFHRKYNWHKKYSATTRKWSSKCTPGLKRGRMPAHQCEQSCRLSCRAFRSTESLS